MQRYTLTVITPQDDSELSASMQPDERGAYYLAIEVDARIAELENALREAMGWNWLDEDNPPPQSVVDQCNKALMER